MTRSVRSNAVRIGCLTLVAAAVMSACAGKDKGEPAAEEKKAPALVSADVAPVASVAFTETVDGVGQVVARPGHVASLSAPSLTRVAHVNVAVGQSVKAGDVLVEFEQLSFDAAVRSADAAFANAEKTAERARRLVQAGVIPKKEAEAAESELEAARTAQSNAKRAQELSRVHAPISGVITQLSAVLGANVDVGQPLVEVTDASVADVMLSLPPTSAARAHTGLSVLLRAGAETGTDTVAQGTVAEVAAVVDTSTRGVAVRITVNRSSRPLRLGETVFGQIVVAQHKQAIVIANDALVPTGEGFKVFVVDSASVAHARPVTVGGRGDQGVWITEGLKAGERVVTKGAYGLDDGAKVAPIKP